MRRLKIGIVGCGAIGSSLAGAIKKDFAKKAEVVSLYDIDIKKMISLSMSLPGKSGLNTASIAELVKNSDLVIESASSKVSWAIARLALSQKRDILLMSAGGIISHVPELLSLAQRHKANVYIPSGAICGIDGLKASKISGIKKVTLTTRKHPESFRGVEYIKRRGIKLGGIKKDKVLFSGPAEDAVRFFPQNINVAAVLSIAGIGPLKTTVKVVASPGVRNNIHEVEIISGAGKIFTRTENLLHPDNPKTSYLAYLSAVAVLKQILEPLKVGS